MSENSKLVQKTKETLKSMGVEVKTTQIYEMYAKILGYKNWNVLQSMNLDIKNELSNKDDLENLLGKSELSDKIRKIEEYENIEGRQLISAMHYKLGHKVQIIDESNVHGISHIVEWTTGVKVAVICRFSKNSKSLDYQKLTVKEIVHLQKAMTVNNCPRGIIYTSMPTIPDKMYKLAVEHRIEIIDYSDLVRLALRAESGQG